MFRLQWLQVGGARGDAPARPNPPQAMARPRAGGLPCGISKRLSVRSVQQLRKRLR